MYSLKELQDLAKPPKIIPDASFQSDAVRNQFYSKYLWQTKRKHIRARDNNECQLCKQQGKVTTASQAQLVVHHIKPIEFYPNFKLDDDNLLTVCHECHNSIHSSSDGYEHEEWW